MPKKIPEPALHSKQVSFYISAIVLEVKDDKSKHVFRLVHGYLVEIIPWLPTFVYNQSQRSAVLNHWTVTSRKLEIT